MVINYNYYLSKLVRQTEEYGITVIFGDFPNPERPTPLRGAFSAKKIHLPPDDTEEALFILLHGVGHIAQWTLLPDERRASYFYNDKKDIWSKFDLENLLRHESAAVPYTLGFLEKSGCPELFSWYQRYFLADQKYISSIFSSNIYNPNLFGTLLGRVRELSFHKLFRIKAKPFPKRLSKVGSGLIHVI